MANLGDKVVLVMDVLRSHDYVVPRSGLRIGSASRRLLLDLFNEGRRARNAPTSMYLSSLTIFLRNRNSEPLGFRRELTSALGLEELGFDEDFWELPADGIREALQSALDRRHSFQRMWKEDDILEENASHFLDLTHRMLTAVDRLVATARAQNDIMAERNMEISTRLEALNAHTSD